MPQIEYLQPEGLSPNGNRYTHVVKVGPWVFIAGQTASDGEGNVVGINLWCEELDWDGGDCDIIVEECPEGLIEDCNEVCAPASWLGDGFCDDGSYEYNGLQIYFNCEEFNNDEGDCDVLQRSTLERPYPNKRIELGK